MYVTVPLGAGEGAGDADPAGVAGAGDNEAEGAPFGAGDAVAAEDAAAFGAGVPAFGAGPTAVDPPPMQAAPDKQPKMAISERIGSRIIINLGKRRNDEMGTRFNSVSS